MWATYLNSLQESLSLRVALVLLGVAMLVALAFSWIVHVRTGSSGEITLVVGSQAPAPAAIAVPGVLESQLHAAGSIWLLLGIFAGAPLLAATFEKGWLEVLFSKGTPRWRILTGRFLGGLTLYALTFALVALSVAARLWWRTGVGTWPIAVTIAMQTLSFAALLSVAAIVSLLQKGVALPIIASAAVWVLTPSLAKRQETYYRLLESHRARAMVDWAYKILPKSTELEGLAATFIQTRSISSWWPIWSTAAFVAVLFGLTAWLLHRKSF